jgi:hypothetical protein
MLAPVCDQTDSWGVHDQFGDVVPDPVLSGWREILETPDPLRELADVDLHLNRLFAQAFQLADDSPRPLDLVITLSDQVVAPNSSPQNGHAMLAIHPSP